MLHTCIIHRCIHISAYVRSHTPWHVDICPLTTNWSDSPPRRRSKTPPGENWEPIGSRSRRRWKEADCRGRRLSSLTRSELGHLYPTLLVVTGTWILLFHILGIVIPIVWYSSEGLKRKCTKCWYMNKSLDCCLETCFSDVWSGVSWGIPRHSARVMLGTQLLSSFWLQRDTGQALSAGCSTSLNISARSILQKLLAKEYSSTA